MAQVIGRAQFVAAFLVPCACNTASDPCDPLPVHGDCSPLLDHDRTDRCFSFDPATAGGLLPRYPWVDAPASELGDPLFSLDRNDWSSFGRCALGPVEPDHEARACNPSWAQDVVDRVCEEFEICVQPEAVTMDDCVFQGGLWRTIRGTDVQDPEDWIVDDPGTRQDPDLLGCKDYASTPDGGIDDARLRDCVRQLGAADQRGGCARSSGVNPPPDLCAEMNE